MRRSNLFILAVFAIAALTVGVPLADGDPPPVPTITSHPALITNLTDATFAFADDDSAATFECNLDDAGFASCPNPVSYSSLVEGPHTFRVRAVDGDTSDPSATFMWQVDTEPPPTPTVTGPPSLTGSPDATFSFEESEGDASLSCTLDAVPAAPCASPTTYFGLADGLHAFTVTATDPAGNSSSTPYTWTIDTTAPPKPTITTGPTDPSPATDATFTFEDADPTATFLCNLDGSGYQPCSSGQQYSNLEDATHTFVVEAVDPLGHVSAPSDPYTWTVDTVHPLVAISDRPPLLTNQTSANFSFSSSPTPHHYECALDGASFATCTSPQHYEGLADGSHTFSVRSVSSGGTPSAATSYSWTIDTVPPETAIASGPPASSHSASAAFTFTSSESGSTFFCSINSSGFAPCSSPQAYSGLGDGTYTFRVQAVDSVGNADPSAATYTWTISGVGPPVADLRPPANVSRLRRSVGYGRLQLRWLKPRDADFDHVGVYVSTSPKTPPRKLLYTGKSQTYTDRHFKNGQYYRYLVVSYDQAKNASGGKPALVPPSALLVAPRPGSAVRTVPTFRWAGIRGAAFYNIQLWKNGEKVLSMWPGNARQVLSRRWSYRGRRHSLSHGVYVWYVWPGFGPRTKARYGQLLGYASFRVR
jgi:hypothetical protein